MSKYFIAIVPKDPLQEKIILLKKQVAETYHSEGALRSPAHITLHMPFELEGEKEKRFLNQFRNIGKGFTSFKVGLNNFGCFEPRVIFVCVKPCETLTDLQKKTVQFMKVNFSVFNQSDDLRGFHPHITIAFRDLKKPLFYEAWKEFAQKEFQEEFNCNSVSLLKHDGKNWMVEQEAVFY
ncbi:MAG: 2'-5' RNA ligase family protein [Bacteroidia bacterium]|nr:2'-5' RNA ligase family protein [Bacteroidia bacterium]